VTVTIRSSSVFDLDIVVSQCPSRPVTVTIRSSSVFDLDIVVSQCPSRPVTVTIRSSSVFDLDIVFAALTALQPFLLMLTSRTVAYS